MLIVLRFFIALILVVLTLQFGCKGPTEPEVNSPRNYKWSADTLSISNGQILMDGVWGTSASNLYAVGHSAGSEGTMWRFDGNKWTNVKLGLFEGGLIPAPFDLAAIHGLSADNIFAVGTHSPFLPGTSFIIHFDGTKWTEQQAPPDSYLLRAVWMNASNDVWACGYNGTLLHYDGVLWKKDSVVVATPPGSTLQLSSIVQIPSGEMFMLGAAYETIPPQMFLRWTYYFFRRENNLWTLRDTFVRNDGEREGRWGGYRLAVLPAGTVYSVGSYGMFQWNETQWIKRYSHINNTAAVFGSDDNNLFVAGSFGLVAHYNGSDWFEYSELVSQNTHYAGGWADETQAFVFGWVAGEKTVVLRGR